MTAAEHSRSKVGADIARSWLLVTGARPEEFERAFASRADQLVLDLEDGVDVKHKAEARRNVAAWLTADRPAWVRINPFTSDEWAADIVAITACPGLLGVVLAKAETGEEVAATADRLGRRVSVVPLVESELGIESAVEIAKARGAFRLAFGSGDYRRDTGASADDLAMAYPRSRLVVASRIGGLPGPIDGPTVGTSHPVLRDGAQVGVALGMTGKLCLELAQLPVINEVISPTSSDVAWAADFLAEFEAGGSVVRDGSDLPRLGRARKIQSLATAFDVRAG